MLEFFEYHAPADDQFDAGWMASDFRPVVERKTSISIFHDIARKATKRKPVNASKSFEDTSWHS